MTPNQHARRPIETPARLPAALRAIDSRSLLRGPRTIVVRDGNEADGRSQAAAGTLMLTK